MAWKGALPDVLCCVTALQPFDPVDPFDPFQRKRGKKQREYSCRNPIGVAFLMSHPMLYYPLL